MIRGLLVSPDRKHLYVVSFTSGSIAVFSRNTNAGNDFGKLSFVQNYQDGQVGIDGLSTPSSVAISPDGKHLYLNSTLDDSVTVFGRNASDGKLTFIEFLKDGEAGGSKLDGASGVTVSPDGKHVYATSFNENAVSVFRRDANTGKLSLQGFRANNFSGVVGLKGANTVLVSPNSKHIYVGAREGDAISFFEATGSQFYLPRP